MKTFLFALGLVLFGTMGLHAQSLAGIWHCQAKKECIDFTPDGRFKIFSDKFVRYGRYMIDEDRLYLKEIGSLDAKTFRLLRVSDDRFIIADEQNHKKQFHLFDRSKMSQAEFKKAITIYFHRDQYQKRLVSN